MKIIDLLNKIANGEEIPKKIKYDGEIYVYAGDDYSVDDKREKWLFSESYDEKELYLREFLLFEIEIIEEDEKIEKLKYDDIITIYTLTDKINKLIDELNKLKGDNNV